MSAAMLLRTYACALQDRGTALGFGFGAEIDNSLRLKHNLDQMHIRYFICYLGYCTGNTPHYFVMIITPS